MLTAQQRKEIRQYLTMNHRILDGNLVIDANGLFNVYNVSETEHNGLMASLRNDDRVHSLAEFSRYDFNHPSPKALMTGMFDKKYRIEGCCRAKVFIGKEKNDGKM